MKIPTRSLFIVICTTVVLLLNGCGPSAENQGVKWTHAELMKRLTDKGLKFTAKETHHGAFYGPAMDFQFAEGEVYVLVTESPQKARDFAGTKGDKAFSWGRFYFEGTPVRLQEIRAALP